MRTLLKMIEGFFIGKENLDQKPLHKLAVFLARFISPFVNLYYFIFKIYKNGKNFFIKKSPQEPGLIEGVLDIIGSMGIAVGMVIFDKSKKVWKNLRNYYLDYKINLKNKKIKNNQQKIAI